jgi:molybdate transport repressor ModE-like protein
MTNPANFDWNDLRILLTVARTGSTIAAGKALGLSQSTVHRRVSALEKALHAKLVSRQPTGYRLTEEGAALLPYAQRVEDAAEDFARQVAQGAQELTGVIRITCPEPIMLRFTRSPLLERFAARHPDLKLEFIMSDRYIDLSKGEADVAFRSGDTDDELVGRKVAESLWAVYASPDYLARHGRPATVDDLKQHDIVAFVEAMSTHRISTWLKEIAPDARIVARNTSVLGLVAAVKSGVGLGPLPTALGEAEDGLVRVLGPVRELTRNWMLLTHPDLRRNPRIAAFFDFVVAERATLKPILTG